MTHFDVYLFNDKAGNLTIENERFQFRYLDSYVSNGSPPLSLSIPVNQTNYGDNIVFPFFENLFPEGELRSLIATSLKTDVSNFSRFLDRMGGEVAGAISILPKGEEPSQHEEPPSAPLSDKELGVIITKIQLSPFLTGESKAMRLSLAGAQNKLPVIIDNEGIKLPGSFPSTHILKPPSSRYTALVENEFLCMRAAKEAGLSTPEVALASFIDSEGIEQHSLQIERYDRICQENKTIRLHQEDICQINHVASPSKYAQDGGPDFNTLFKTIRTLTIEPAASLKELVRRVLFNLLIGNCDAHGKNFSLLHINNIDGFNSTGRSARLSPAYDLVSTMIYADLSAELAMPFGDIRKINDISNQSIVQFEQMASINLRRAKNEYISFVEGADDAIKNNYEDVAAACYPKEEIELEKILSVTTRHREALIRSLNQ